jgi:hypothetical protein
MERGEDDVIEANMEEARLVIHEPRVKVDLTKYVERHAFAFDDVLDEAVSNDAVYSSTVKPLVATIFRSGKVSLRRLQLHPSSTAKSSLWWTVCETVCMRGQHAGHQSKSLATG